MPAIYKTFDVALDLKQALTNYEWRVVEGDTGNKLVVTLTDGGTPVDLTDARIIMLFSRGTSIAMQSNTPEDGSITVSGANHNIITVSLKNGSFAPGFVESHLQILTDYDSDLQEYKSLVTTARFNFRCDRSLFSDEYIMSLDSYSILNDLISRVQDIISGRIQANWNENDNTSPQYIQNKPTSMTPTTHASTHATGGSDAITPADIGAMASDATPTPAAHASTHEIGGTDALPAASTSEAGLVQLYDGVDSTSDTKAATPNAVKTAYDLANDAIPSAEKGAVSGVATLDENTKVAAAQASSSIVVVTANKTLELSDAGKLIEVNSASAVTITIPTNASVAFPVGTELEILRWGSGAVTLSPASGVMLASAGSSSYSSKSIDGENGIVGLKYIGWNNGHTEEFWLVAGNVQ